MGFEKGNQLGKNAHHGRFIKEKYLKKWDEVFEKDPLKKLTQLAEENYSEFLRLGIAAMPKDHNIDAKVEHNLPPEQLQQAVDFVLNFFASRKQPDQAQPDSKK
jgi:hypothetical protein